MLYITSFTMIALGFIKGEESYMMMGALLGLAGAIIYQT